MDVEPSTLNLTLDRLRPSLNFAQESSLDLKHDSRRLAQDPSHASPPRALRAGRSRYSSPRYWLVRRLWTPPARAILALALLSLITAAGFVRTNSLDADRAAYWYYN
ncbi:hypothetical protein GGX14DRAFT_556016 [Mycena pura]|uniref:Uncharacterized protein n=1 Tax=Mycena pura TaxID=153505 RepID=A0AAD6YS11_9AGAR|nr:hypothetical protein GGX14DRAFT_556016 [Mycena pura]